MVAAKVRTGKKVQDTARSSEVMRMRMQRGAGWDGGDGMHKAMERMDGWTVGIRAGQSERGGVSVRVEGQELRQ